MRFSLRLSRTGINWNDLNVLARTGVNWNDLGVLSKRRLSRWYQEVMKADVLGDYEGS